MSNERATNVSDFIGECNAGIFNEKLSISLSDAAMSQINHGKGGKKAKVTIEFTFQQMGDNDQVIISHKLATNNPTKRGKKLKTILPIQFFMSVKVVALLSTHQLSKKLVNTI